MGLVHQDHASGRFGGRHHLSQRAERAGGAVHGVDDHHARPVPPGHAREVLGVVVAEGMRGRTGGPHAFPQRHVREAVQVHRRLGVGDHLQQAQVRRVAGLAQ
jgi:plasmid replication initiation protein